MTFLAEWPGGSWQETLRLAALSVGIYWAALWLAVTFWAGRDARVRSGSGAFSALAVLLVAAGSVPGLALYLLVRPRSTERQRYLRSLQETALQRLLMEEEHCPACKRVVRAEYLMCPACLMQLKRSCAACSKPLAENWQVCPFCMAGTNETAVHLKDRRRARQAAAVPVVAVSITPAAAAAPAVAATVQTAPGTLAS
ncbi:MAG: zinc ribbon domain-containing protein [Dehalococcoidia bacterium]